MTIGGRLSRAVSDVAAYHYPWIPVRWLLKDRFEASARRC